MADVIEACSNTSRLEVIADVTMIRSSTPPRCWRWAFIVSGTITRYDTGKRRKCRVGSAGTQTGWFPA